MHLRRTRPYNTEQMKANWRDWNDLICIILTRPCEISLIISSVNIATKLTSFKGGLGAEIESLQFLHELWWNMK